MNKVKSVRWLSLLLAAIMVVCVLPMGTLVNAGVTEYDDFMEKLEQLEVYADEYAETTYKDPGELVLNFIRTGVSRYLDDNWVALAKQEIVGFTQYVEIQDAKNGTSVMDLRDNGNVTGIEEFTLDNRDKVDFGHMFGCMNISYVNAGSADLSGWAGDICDLLYYCVGQANIPVGTVDEMTTYIFNNCFGVDAENAFGWDDFYGDMDAYYLISEYNKAGGSKKFSEIMKDYFTADLDDVDRTVYFMNNRFGVADEDPVKEKEAVRKAIYEAYSGDTGIKILESKRGLSTYNDLREACCYALADYIYSQAKGQLIENSGSEDVASNGYYTVFSNEHTILAHGIEQDINYAQTVDGKQIVYYVSTIDVNRDDVMVMANYKDNDPSKGWGLDTTEKQTAALVDNYKNKTDADGNKLYEYFNPIVAINGDGFNIYNGTPGGLLVMDGKEWKGSDRDDFFAILKDGTAVIGTQAEYAAMKDQIKEAVGAFGATLIKDGKINVTKSANYIATRGSRTAIGITADGKVVMMVLDGRQLPFSAGGALEEIAQIMFEAGCVDAINLDGGGSTTYLSKPAGSDSIQLVNRPSDGYQRNVATTLVAISTAKPSNEFSTAIITSDYEYITVGTSMQMNATGISNTGNAAEIPADAKWTVSDESIGSIDSNGVFTANSLGDVNVEYVVDGEVSAAVTIHVVVPDALKMESTSMNVTYGVPAKLPIIATYNGYRVCVKESDFFVQLQYPDAGTINGLSFVASEEAGYRTFVAGAALIANFNLLAYIQVNVYKAGESTFDFDNATMGNRNLAWNREVTNAKSIDNQLYRILDPDSPVKIDYTFALDMTAIEMPPQLEPLKEMLPDGTNPDSAAWDFLLALAERVCVQTNVTIRAEFSKDLEIDISDLKVSTDYFKVTSTNLDVNNVLTIVCNWVDQTQPIDPSTANSLCVLSGIKATVKDSAGFVNDELLIANNGTVSYGIYLATSALHDFASKPENQAIYGIQPYQHSDEEYPDGCRVGDHDRGGCFSSQYVDFADVYVLDSEMLQGWQSEGKDYYYYENNVPLTGIQLVNDRYDQTQKRFYEFDENGKLISEQGTTGLIEFKGDLYYPAMGIIRTGWYEIDGEYYYFHPDTGKAADGVQKIKEFIYPNTDSTQTDTYTYTFENCVLVRGDLRKERAGLTWGDTGIRYRWAGDWKKACWFDVDGNTYHVGKNYPYFVTTGYAHYVVDFPVEKDQWCFLFDEKGVLQKDYVGPADVVINGVEKTIFFENGLRFSNDTLHKVDFAYGIIQGSDGYYYYINTWEGEIAKNTDKYVDADTANSLVPAGTYTFDANGRMTNAQVSVGSKPADVTTSVLGAAVNVNSDAPCKAYYVDGSGNYVAIEAVDNPYESGYNFAAPTGATVQIVLAGDIDGNGKVDSADLDAISAITADDAEPTGVTSVTADINGNGEVNAADRLLLARALLEEGDDMKKDLEW